MVARAAAAKRPPLENRVPGPPRPFVPLPRASPHATGPPPPLFFISPLLTSTCTWRLLLLRLIYKVALMEPVFFFLSPRSTFYRVSKFLTICQKFILRSISFGRFCSFVCKDDGKWKIKTIKKEKGKFANEKFVWVVAAN